MPLASRVPGAVLALCAALPLHAADNVDVAIDGVEGELAANVRTFLSIASDSEKTLNERRVRRLHAGAPGEIKAALQPFGYYRPDIESKLTAADGEWQARYTIDKGRPTTIDELVLQATGEGRDQPEVQAAIQASALKEDQRLVHSRYQATKSALLNAANNTGYLEATYKTAQIRVRPEDASAKVLLELATGPRYYFGDVTIKQDILDPDFVRQYLDFDSGDVFNADRLTDLQLRLSNTDYFSQIEIQARRERTVTEADSDNQPLPRVPVTVRATPRDSKKYTASAGYGTDTGPRVGAGVEFRRLNRRGHKFRANARVSAIEQALTADYIIPIDDVVTDRLVFGATVKQQEFGDADSLIYRTSAAREDAWDWGRRRLYLNLQRERFDFGGGARTSNLLYPGVTLSYQNADNSLRVRRGFSVSGDVHGGVENLVSTVSFLQATLESRTVHSLGEDIRLLTRAKLGATETSDFTFLPPSQRFFTGGARSVRGYPYQEISPENDDGDDIGGQYLAEASVEAEYLFYGDFGAALFFDVGDAPAELDDLETKRAVGIGFRWLSPVGTVRLDFAHPLDDSSPDVRFHFSLGPDL